MDVAQPIPPYTTYTPPALDLIRLNLPEALKLEFAIKKYPDLACELPKHITASVSQTRRELLQRFCDDLLEKLYAEVNPKVKPEFTRCDEDDDRIQYELEQWAMDMIEDGGGVDDSEVNDLLNNLIAKV
jgi:hypothetical protein